MRYAAIALSVLAGAGAYLATGQTNRDGIAGNWSMQWNEAKGKLRLLLERSDGKNRMSHSTDEVPMSQFAGLTREQLMAPGGGVVHFRIVREAGAIECEGYLKAGGGGGVFRFQADLNYGTAMKSLGYADLDGEKVFALALHDVTTTFVRDMAAAGYPNPPFEKLLAMRIHGVSPEFVREMSSLNLKASGIDQLIAMRIHGVTAAFVREIRAQGLDGASIDKLIAFRIHRVTPEFVREVRVTFPNVTGDQLVAMRIHQVTPEFIQRMSARGLKNMTVDQLVSMKIHGIAN